MKKLTKTKLKKFKTFFVNKRERLLNSYMQKVNDSITMGFQAFGDEIDLVQIRQLKEITDRLSSRDRDGLHKIDYAIKRIADGSFGICEECEEPIPEKRLEAIPDCSFCIQCAEQIEFDSKQYRQIP